MERAEVAYLGSIWPAYFPNDVFHAADKRMSAVLLFKTYIQGSGRFLFENQNDSNGTVELDLSILQEVLPFPDFISTLRTQPNEVLGCLVSDNFLYSLDRCSLRGQGLALSAIKAMKSPVTSQLNNFYSIRPRVTNLEPHTPFAALKSNISGQLISLRGHVVRVSPAQPYVTIGAFKCSKCLNISRKTFVDGIFSPPTQCSTPKSLPSAPPSPHLSDRCKNRYLDFQRSSAITSDLQRIKLQEYIDPDSPAGPGEGEGEGSESGGGMMTPNVPRTFEAELRGEELVDSCVSGDLVVMVGIVKAVQQVSGGCSGGSLTPPPPLSL
jgi:DNA helicase MCM8